MTFKLKYSTYCNKELFSAREDVTKKVTTALPSELSTRFLELVETLTTSSNKLESFCQLDFLQGFYRLCDWCFNETDFLTCPASTKYHLACPNGLFIHSLNVAENAVKICNILQEDLIYKPEIHWLIVSAFFHDLGKAGHPGKPHYIKNEPTPRQKAAGYGPTYPYSYSKDTGVYLAVPHQSVYYIQKFMDIPVEYAQAIIIHDGQYVQDNKSYATKEEPVSLILHYADSWAGFVQEKRVFNDVL